MTEVVETTIFPWLQANWQRIAKNPDNQHHGVLLVGKSGIGKREFALAFSQWLICDNSSSQLEGQTGACGSCQNCRLFLAGNHPDFHVLTTELEAVEGRQSLISQFSDRYQDSKERDKKAKPSRIISIDQVRQLIQRFSTRAHIANTKVALIQPADHMNVNAANGLLKLLEEPPQGSVLILVSADPGRLPSTIRSRCMNHILSAPDLDASRQWLNQNFDSEIAELALSISDDGPLNVASMIESGQVDDQKKCILGTAGVAAQRVNPLELASQLSKMNFEQVLIWLQRFVTEVIKIRVASTDSVWLGKLPLDVQTLSVDRLYGLYDRILHYRKICREPVNEQLALEDLLLVLQRTAT